MVNILHDALFFVVNALNSFKLFSFLKFSAKIIIVPADIFILAAIAEKFNTAV